MSAFVFGQYVAPLSIRINNDSILLNKDNFEKNLLNEKICKNILLDYSIVNTSNKDYAIVVDKEFFLVYEDVNFLSYLQPTDNLLVKQIFQPAILIKSNNQIINTGFSDDGYYFRNLPTAKKVINNNIAVVKANSEYRIKTKISLPINNNNIKSGTFSQQIFLSIVSQGLTEGLLSLILRQDSTVIEKNINKSTKEKFRRKGIIFYDDLIYSNEIPLYVK